MVASSLSKVELSWDQVFSGDLPDSPARKLWRSAVAEVVERATAALPQSGSRIEKAMAIVLSGDIELLPDGTAKVASQSNGQTTYHIANGSCSCRDFDKAPGNFCKHRLGYAIYKRASAVAKERLEQLDGNHNGHQGPAEPTETHQNAPQATITGQADVQKTPFLKPPPA